MFTVMTVEGNLTADPVLRTVPAERGREATSVTNLRIAVSERSRNEQGVWVAGEPEFYDVAVWGISAEHVAQLRNGDRVMVHGEMRPRMWASEDGQPRRSRTITAAMIGASLRYAPARPVRAELQRS